MKKRVRYKMKNPVNQCINRIRLNGFLEVT